VTAVTFGGVTSDVLICMVGSVLGFLPAANALAGSDKKSSTRAISQRALRRRSSMKKQSKLGNQRAPLCTEGARDLYQL
jgi:hypothetical protein